MKVYIVEVQLNRSWTPMSGTRAHRTRVQAEDIRLLQFERYPHMGYRVATYVRQERSKPKGGKRRTRPNQGER